MKTLSLKLDKEVFGETEKILEKLKKPRNRYINEALEFYNKFQRRKLIEEKIEIESHLVREDSMAVLKEFEEMDYDN